MAHPLLAEEVLAGGAFRESSAWRAELGPLAEAFIEDLLDLAHSDADEIRGLLVELFTQRESVSSSGSGTDAGFHFSELIEEISAVEPAICLNIFRKLTERCPLESHFWNHRGRFLIYRTKQNYQEAESFLLEAVRLSQHDHVHHHTLGMVRRFWIEDKVRQLQDQPIELILAEIKDLVQSALEAFAESRRLDSDDSYGYITPIQLILWVANKLKDSFGAQSVAELTESSPDFRRWILEVLPEVHYLLAAVQRLYSSLDQRVDRYVSKCTADLSKLYGDYDAVVRTWEIALARRPGDDHSQRALASVYVDRKGGAWDRLAPDELRRILSLTDANLRRNLGTNEDYRLWFSAYRRLSEFDYNTAIARLRAWGERTSNVHAFYYMYILHFLAWYDGQTQDTQSIMACIDETRSRAYGRRHDSFEWFSKFPTRCPIIQASELGERAGGFWVDTSPLRRVNGWIDDIKGSQAGTIAIDRKVKAFFVPGPYPWKRNQEVNIYLGFSFEGFRGWRPEPDWIEGASRTDDSKESKAGKPSEASNAPHTHPSPPSSDSTNHIDAAMNARIREFIVELATVKKLQKTVVPVADCEERVRSVFPEFRADNFVDFLLSTDGIHVRTRDGIDIVDIEHKAALSVATPRAASSGNASWRTGSIKFVRAEEGFGFIVDDENGDYFFRTREVRRDVIDRLRKGVRVRYEGSSGRNRPVARNIEIL